MNKIYKSSYKSDICINHNEKIEEIETFLNLNIEDILINHHKNNADSTEIRFSSDQENTNLLLFITQNDDLIKDLKMLKCNSKNNNDLFEVSSLNNLNKISINDLLKNIVSDKNQDDYTLFIDNRFYSFRLVKGAECENLSKNLERYREEISTVNEYKIKI